MNWEEFLIRNQIFVAILVNMVALVGFLGPSFFLWHKARVKSVTSRDRWFALLTYILFFVGFWWGYVYLDNFFWSKEGFYWFYDFAQEVTFSIDYISLLSLPIVFVALFRSKFAIKKHKVAAWFLLFLLFSVLIHGYILLELSLKGLVSKLP